MIKFFLFTLTLFWTLTMTGQHAFRDAEDIRANLVEISGDTFRFKADPASVETLCAFLRRYLPEPYRSDPNLTESQVFAYFSGNPFFGGQIDEISGGAMSTRAAGFLKGAGSVLGNIDVTNFADGLARFLVERSKEELNVAFFRKFQEFLKSYPEAKVLFPTTSDFIGAIHAYQYTALLPALRAAFHKDMNSFGGNLLELRELTVGDCPKGERNAACLERIQAMQTFIETKEGRAIIATLLISDNIIKGNNAAAAIEHVINDNIVTGHDDNFSNIVNFINLVSISLRSDQEDLIWVSQKDITMLFGDNAGAKLYFGLLYASDRHHVFKGHNIQIIVNSEVITLDSLLTDLAEQWDLSNDFILRFKKMAQAAAVASGNAKRLVDEQSLQDGEDILLYAEYAEACSDFFEAAAEFLKNIPALNTELVTLEGDIAKFVTYIGTATDIAYDIKSRNYGALVLHSSEFLGEIFGSRYTFKDRYIKYGTFMASVVQADNPDEVKNAIEAAVLPVGSSSIKRETDVNIAVNAYLGAYCGYEYMPALPDNETQISAGLAAPVGVAISWGKLFRDDGDEPSGGKSISLFLSVIDIGALAAYRFEDDQTNISSDIKLENIISPGLFVYYGFGKCPISVGFGAQLSPQLRGVSETAQPSIDSTRNISVRYGVSVVVDIPLLNLYTKEE